MFIKIFKFVKKLNFFLILKLQHPNLGLKIVLYMVYVRIYIFEYKKASTVYLKNFPDK